ncbi:MAG TPA: hypothetical protein VI589_06915 [Vicinamibacteria bacterium]
MTEWNETKARLEYVKDQPRVQIQADANLALARIEGLDRQLGMAADAIVREKDRADAAAQRIDELEREVERLRGYMEGIEAKLAEAAMVEGMLRSGLADTQRDYRALEAKLAWERSDKPGSLQSNLMAHFERSKVAIDALAAEREAHDRTREISRGYYDQAALGWEKVRKLREAIRDALPSMPDHTYTECGCCFCRLRAALRSSDEPAAKPLPLGHEFRPDAGGVCTGPTPFSDCGQPESAHKPEEPAPKQLRLGHPFVASRFDNRGEYRTCIFFENGWSGLCGFNASAHKPEPKKHERVSATVPGSSKGEWLCNACNQPWPCAEADAAYDLDPGIMDRERP